MSSSVKHSDNRTWSWRRTNQADAARKKASSALRSIGWTKIATQTRRARQATNLRLVNRLQSRPTPMRTAPTLRPSLPSGREDTLWSYGHCIGDSIQMYFSPGSGLQQTAVAVFDNDACSNPPVKLTVSSVFKRKASPNGNAAACESGDSSHFSVSGCPDSSWGSAELMFGAGQPCLRVMTFLGPNCGSTMDAMTTYSADGTCHSDTNETSYVAAINMDTSTATLTTYSDTACELEVTNLELSRYQLLNWPCVFYACENPLGCQGIFSFGLGTPSVQPVSGTGSMTTSKSATVVYDENTCSSAPTQFIVTDDEKCFSLVVSVCEAANVEFSSLAYYAVECFDDLNSLVTKKLNTTPYLVVETYTAETDCKIQESVVVYNADGECHVNVVDGSSFRVKPSIGGSITVAIYPNSGRSDSDVDYITIGAKYINTDACFKGSMKLYANMTDFTASSSDSPPPPQTFGNGYGQ